MGAEGKAEKWSSVQTRKINGTSSNTPLLTAHLLWLLGELFCCCCRDLLDNDSLGAAALVHLTGDRHFFSREGKQLRILAGGGHGIRDRPIDRAIFGKDDERRPRLGAGDGALAADGFVEAFGKRAS